MSELPDCVDCGACCFASHPHHVPLTGADHARLAPTERARFAVFEGTRCYMRVEEGKCAALALEGGRFVCTVYERRPQVCRDLERGGPACAYEREAKGDRAVEARRTKLEVSQSAPASGPRQEFTQSGV